VAEVTGRLDLFAGEVLERAWRTAPAPRRVLLDLNPATEVTSAGADLLKRLVGNSDPDGRAAVLARADAPRLAALVAAGVMIYEVAKDAVAALGEVPAAVQRPLTVTLRSNRSGVTP
jgi:hypothetical protein